MLIQGFSPYFVYFLSTTQFLRFAFFFHHHRDEKNLIKNLGVLCVNMRKQGDWNRLGDQMSNIILGKFLNKFIKI